MEFRSWADELSRWARRRGRNVILLASTDSTNRVALAAAAEAEGPPLAAWVLALHQRSGRGRFARPWASPTGAGVYASWVLRVPRVALETLPLVVGVGLCEGLSSLGVDCRLKWPNDVQLRGLKLGGILLQSHGGGDPAAVVAGFGVNHSHRAADLPSAGATSLALVRPDRLPVLDRLTIALVEAVEDEVERHGVGRSWDPGHALERYSAWTAHHRGDGMRFRSGDELVSGRFAGFSAKGHLRLETADGERSFSAGEIAPSLAADSGARSFHD